MNDAPLKKCPECGKSKLTKLISAAGFQLKGSGWYATDFKDSGKKPAESTSTKDTSKEAKTETTKSSKDKPKKDTKSD